MTKTEPGMMGKNARREMRYSILMIYEQKTIMSKIYIIFQNCITLIRLQYITNLPDVKAVESFELNYFSNIIFYVR